MKTKIIHYVIFILCFGMYGHTQQAKYYRELEVTIVATENYEESRQALMKQCSGENYYLVSLIEIKDGSSPASTCIEFFTDEAGFQSTDTLLEALGHISFKKSSLVPAATDLDTTFLKHSMDQNNALISALIAKIAEMPELIDILYKIDVLQKRNKQIAFNIMMLDQNTSMTNHIVIRLSE